jgi:hypothetical protein
MISAGHIDSEKVVFAIAATVDVASIQAGSKNVRSFLAGLQIVSVTAVLVSTGTFFKEEGSTGTGIGIGVKASELLL